MGEVILFDSINETSYLWASWTLSKDDRLDFFTPNNVEYYLFFLGEPHHTFYSSEVVEQISRYTDTYINKVYLGAYDECLIYNPSELGQMPITTTG